MSTLEWRRKKVKITIIHQPTLSHFASNTTVFPIILIIFRAIFQTLSIGQRYPYTPLAYMYTPLYYMYTPPLLHVHPSLGTNLLHVQK